MMAFGIPGSGLEVSNGSDVQSKELQVEIDPTVDDIPADNEDSILMYMYDYGMRSEMGLAVPMPPASVRLSIVVPLPPPPDPEEPAPGDPVRMDILFCLDTTGSMGDEIAVAKATIIDIANDVKNGDPQPDVRYGLVIYRDVGDEYVTRVYDFMSAEDLSVVLQGVVAFNGGDYPESVSRALHESVHDVSWDLDASCAIYLIGDAPPHTDYSNGYDHVKVAGEAAELGIVINAIGCSGIRGNEMEFKEVVDLTGGEFVYLNYFNGGREDGSIAFRGVAFAGVGSGSKSDKDEDILLDSYSHSLYSSGRDNDLDGVLTGMLRSMAEDEGVEYDD
jgi:hypothetical protein